MEERRYTPAEMQLEDRDGKPPVITGYAAVFNSLSQELPLSEGARSAKSSARRAFAEVLTDGSDVLARFEHSQLLGRTKNGTLRLYRRSSRLALCHRPARHIARPRRGNAHQAR